MFVYMIECSDGSLYTGIASDVVKRLRAHYHRLPECAKYTRSRQMVGIAAFWEVEDKITACRLEYRIKKLSRSEKNKLIDGSLEILSLLPGAERNAAVRRAETEEIAETLEKIRQL